MEDTDHLCAAFMELKSSIVRQNELQEKTNKLLRTLSENLEITGESIDKLTAGLAKSK